MKTSLWTCLVAASLCCGCGGSDDSIGDAGASGDGGSSLDGPIVDADPNAPDADPNALDAAPVARSRGLQWVHDNPMFISALTVNMPAPPAAVVHEYFDDFHANAVHLWQNGLPTRMDGWAAPGRADFRFFSWVTRDGTGASGGVIGGYPSDADGRIGFQIGDEPRTVADLVEMAAGADAVRAADPNALIIINFTLSTEDDLDDILDYYSTSVDADVVSFDTYTRNHNVYGRMALFRDTSMALGEPYWCYLRSYVAEGENDYSNESDMRWNAFAHMTYGYTGYSWFFYQIAPPNDVYPALFETINDFGATKTARWDYAAQINVELAHLGRAITQLTNTDVRYISSLVVQPTSTSAWAVGAGGDPYISAISPGFLQDALVGFFIGDSGEQYVMIQNVNHTGGGVPVNSSNDATIRIDFDFSGASDPSLDKSAVESLNKQTGAVETISLVSTGGDQAYLEVTLAAGDPILFKYKNAAPFALQSL